MLQSGDHNFLVTPTLHWRPDNRLTKRVLRFSALCCIAYIVYPSVGWVALFLVDLS